MENSKFYGSINSFDFDSFELIFEENKNLNKNIHLAMISTDDENSQNIVFHKKKIQEIILPKNKNSNLIKGKKINLYYKNLRKTNFKQISKKLF